MSGVTRSDIEAVQRPVHTLWSLLFMHPCVVTLGPWLANRTSISPLALTVASFLLSLVSAFLFLQASFAAVVAGVVLYQVSNILDALDGMVARARPGSGSVFALAADHTLDPWRLVLNVAAVAWVGFQGTGDTTVMLWAGLFLAVHFADWIQPRMISFSRSWYRDSGTVVDTAADRLLITVKQKLENLRLRFVFFSVHEREVLVLGLGPLLSLQKELMVAATLLTALFFLMRVRLDLALLKRERRTGTREYLGDSENRWEAGLQRGESGRSA